MNLSLIDWLIAFVSIAALVFVVGLSKKLVRSVVDYLSAGRAAGRYMLTVSQGMAFVGAITIVGQWEVNYVAGFALRWWEFIMALVLLFMTVSGWVLYRFRQTRALTIAQFLEMRYSRNFRVFAGILAFISGLLNFGVFPAVVSRFMIYFCGFPLSLELAGLEISTFPLVMAGIQLISLYFVFGGGQISVLITEFIQGVYSNFTFLILILFCLFYVDWEQIAVAVATAPPEASLINPYKTSEVPDFNFWYFLINVIGVIYVKLSWQGAQGFNSSAKSAHEAKMGEVLGNLRDITRWLFLVFIPIVGYTVLHHADFAHIADHVNQTLAAVETEAVRNQIRIPLVLSKILPVGLMGAFLTLMLMATISTHSSYMHSWGAIFIQDVIMPFRKKTLTPEQHLGLLRKSIGGVCAFIFFFSWFFPLTDFIYLYFAITAAIFVGGSGAVIIGGLYWRKGTTAAAWSAMIIGSVISITGIIVQQIDPDFPINGQVFWGISMGVSSLVYVLISLLGERQDFNMDKMLHRGSYALQEETIIGDEVPLKGWRVLGINKEFTKGDKIIYVAAYGWTFLWVAVFIIGTVFNLTSDVADAAWLTFWKSFVLINLVVSSIVVIWFTIGGVKDFKDMIQRLKTMVRDHGDDGSVRENNYSLK
jgi:SSS family solute:Na+ symporter